MVKNPGISENGFTIKQLNTNLIKNTFVFLMNNIISTNRIEVKFSFSLPIGPNKIVQKEISNILDEILVHCFLVL